ncbi:MAG TPA: nuclear transport factor 2 family protein [Allosphingosinicella sp.]|nr:nuclear transport factor 2 family protein [Allosphingosinicella sp.]
MTGFAFRGAAVVMLLALASAGSAAPPEPPTGETLPRPALEAAAVVDAFHAALRRGDSEGALALVADDAIVFEDGRVERTKAEYALHHAGADAAFSKAVSTKRLSRTGHAGGGLALIASESRTRGRFRGQDVDRIMIETMVLRREPAGAWKIVHIHWSSAQPATE